MCKQRLKKFDNRRFLSANMQCRASTSLSSSSESDISQFSGSDISQILSYNSFIIVPSFHYKINSSNSWIMSLENWPRLILTSKIWPQFWIWPRLALSSIRSYYFKGLKSIVNCRNCLLFTVFENHIKSLIQHCERSELRLYFEWTKVH